jgi:hypothetical protein
MPTQSAERLATGRARITQRTAPVIIPTANRDNPSTSMPDRFPTASREGLFDNLSDDGESGDEGVHGGGAVLSGLTPTNPDAPADEMGDEGHSRITTTQRTTSDGSTVHSGTNLMVSGRINSDVGLSPALSSSLATQNGKKVKEVKYSPKTGKYTLYYGKKDASGRYELRTELSAPAPASNNEPSLLSRIGRAVGPSGGANYMLDRLNSRGRVGGG